MSNSNCSKPVYTDCTYSMYIGFFLCLFPGVEGSHIYSIFCVWLQTSCRPWHFLNKAVEKAGGRAHAVCTWLQLRLVGNCSSISVTLIDSVRESEPAGHYRLSTERSDAEEPGDFGDKVTYWHWLLFEGDLFEENIKKREELIFPFYVKAFEEAVNQFQPRFVLKQMESLISNVKSRKTKTVILNVLSVHCEVCFPLIFFWFFFGFFFYFLNLWIFQSEQLSRGIFLFHLYTLLLS